MKKILLSLAVICLVVVAFAKNEGSKNADKSAENAAISTQLSGIVTDKVSNEALVGVEVEIEGLNQKVYTDFDGKFSFNNLKPGEYKIIASYISYEKIVVDHVELVKNNQVAILLEASN